MLIILNLTVTLSRMIAYSIFLPEKAPIPKLSEKVNHHVHSLFSPQSSESVLRPIILVLEVLDIGSEGLERHILVITRLEI